MGKMHDALKKAQQARHGGGSVEVAGPAEPAPAERPVAPAPPAAAERPTAVTIAPSFRGDVDPHLVSLVDPHGAHAEQYRTLRTNLLAAMPDKQVQVVVITSSMPREGKSFSSAKLACAMAEDPERKIELVDADLRKPTQHKLLGLDNQRGLSDYLTGGTMLEMVLQRCRLPNLWVMPAGRMPPNPSELLGSKRMDDLLTRLRRDYDFVVIDMPPVNATTDPGVLVPRVDGAVLVVRMNQTPREAARRAIEQLHKARGTVLGLLLTALEGDVKDYYYHYPRKTG